MSEIENSNQDNELNLKASEAMHKIASEPNVLKSITDTLLPSYGKNKAVVDEVIKYAEDNLKASHILKNNGLTALSIYHLEQSAEMITKSLYYMFDLKIKTTHNQIDIIADFREKLNGKLGNNATTTLFGSIDSALQTFRDTGISQLARLDEQSINNYFGVVEQLKSALVSVNKTDFSTIINETVSGLDREKRARVLASVNSRRNKLLNFASVLSIVLIIGLITYPHEKYTRYHGEDISPKDYDDGRVAIVKFYDRIYNHLNDYIKTRKEYLDSE